MCSTLIMVLRAQLLKMKDLRSAKRTAFWSLIFVCAIVYMYNVQRVLNMANNSADQDVNKETRKVARVGASLGGEGNISAHLPASEYALFPSRNFYDTDRIINQLAFIGGSKNTERWGKMPLKTIMLNNGLDSWDQSLRAGRKKFLKQHCKVDTCQFISRLEPIQSADAVIFSDHARVDRSKMKISPEQIWILHMPQSPYATKSLKAANGLYNWTATYRRDSELVTPYTKFVLFHEDKQTIKQTKNYAEGKTKKVAWIVSNCHSNNNRLEYARELSKYIQVDIYGECGNLRCREKGNLDCMNMLNTDYKFYLSFEDCNCRDYITESFFVNALQNNIVPIVMGAAPEDYAQAAPYHSYIHVDDHLSPLHLATYLNQLDKNDDRYNEYFQWKGTGSFMNTFFWCRVCALLHDMPHGRHVYTDIERWWRGNSACIGSKSWRDIARVGTN